MFVTEAELIGLFLKLIERKSKLFFEYVHGLLAIVLLGERLQDWRIKIKGMKLL
jgi:hypothetical protein